MAETSEEEIKQAEQEQVQGMLEGAVAEVVEKPKPAGMRIGVGEDYEHFRVRVAFGQADTLITVEQARGLALLLRQSANRLQSQKVRMEKRERAAQKSAKTKRGRRHGAERQEVLEASGGE